MTRHDICRLDGAAACSMWRVACYTRWCRLRPGLVCWHGKSGEHEDEDEDNGWANRPSPGSHVACVRAHPPGISIHGLGESTSSLWLICLDADILAQASILQIDACPLDAGVESIHLNPRLAGHLSGC